MVTLATISKYGIYRSPTEQRFDLAQIGTQFTLHVCDVTFSKTDASIVLQKSVAVLLDYHT